MRVLLTGASGNIGQGVLRALVGQGHHVLALARDVRRLRGVCGPFGNKAEAVVCDLSTDLSRNLRSDYDAVIHTAAHATAEESPDAHVVHNVIALRQLIQHAARRPGRPFIFLSSLSVYGTISEPVVDEQTAVHNPGSYGASKLLGEMLLRECGTRLSTLALRLPGIIGPGAHAPWLARTLAAARAGRPVTIYSPDTPFNNAVHVDDLGRFAGRLLTAISPGFDVVTVGARDARPVREVVETMLAGCTSHPELHFVEPPRRPFAISIQKAADCYGYAPMSVLDCVRRFAADASGPTLRTPAEPVSPLNSLHLSPA